MFSPIEDIIAEAKAGRMCVLVDDEDRENEGDLYIPAQFADAETINFMVREGRGLVCLALPPEMTKRLGLSRVVARGESPFKTGFTESIEAAQGVTTGISAFDRARTIATAIHPDSGPDDLIIPGHIFPIEAVSGGVLERPGHTEAAVDIARLAGLSSPAGVICEIMKDDGHMARVEDLIPFCRKHGLKIGTIASLVSFRQKKTC